MTLAVAGQRPSEWRWWGALAAVAAFGMVARAAAIVTVATPVESDAAQYLCMARNLALSGALEDCYNNFAFFSAGYPMLLAILFTLLGDHLWVAYAANVVLGGLSILLVALIARHCTGSRLAALCAAAFAALYVEHILYADYLLKENLAIPVLLGMLLLTLRLRERSGRLCSLGLLGVLLAAQALIGLTGLALLPALVAYIAITEGWRVGLRDGMTVLAITLLCLCPWLLRNDKAVGAPVLNTNGGFNLYLGNNPNAGLLFTAIDNTPMAEGWHALRRERGEYGADRALHQLAIDYIGAHPAETAVLWTQRLFAFWTPPYHKILDPGTPKLERLLRLVWLAQFVVIAGLAFVPLAKPRALPPLALLYGSVLLCGAAYAPFFIIYRFRVPEMVMLCIAAAWGVHLLICRWSRGAQWEAATGDLVASRGIGPGAD